MLFAAVLALPYLAIGLLSQGPYAHRLLPAQSRCS